jgi:hypothetical protein
MILLGINYIDLNKLNKMYFKHVFAPISEQNVAFAQSALIQFKIRTDPCEILK